MPVLTLGTAFNALGKALGIVKVKDGASDTKVEKDTQSGNRPPSSPTPTEPDSGSPDTTRTRQSTRLYRPPVKEDNPKVKSDIAKVYVGASPNTYFASQRAYEISRPFRLNPPRKLVRTNLKQPDVVTPETTSAQVIRVGKKKPVKGVAEGKMDVFGPLSKNPARPRGKKRAREEDTNDFKANDENSVDAPSIPKRVRIGHGLLGRPEPSRPEPSSLPTTSIPYINLENPVRRSTGNKKATTSMVLRSSLQGRSGAPKKVQRVHFASSVVFTPKGKKNKTE